MEEIKVSIVVPAYNVEQYISKCLKSLINQTLKEIEIIVVNDGSTDGTEQIIRKFDDERILLINQENYGPSVARNVALEVAKGDYIGFVDSDDWVDEDYFSCLYDCITKYDADIAVAGMYREREAYQKCLLKYNEKEIYTSLEDKIRVCGIPKFCYVCNKLFKSEKIKPVKFQKGVYFEDVLWLPEIIKKSEKMVTVPKIAYHYRVNKNSIVSTCPDTKKQFDNYNAQKYIVNFFKANHLELSKKEKLVTKKTYFLSNLVILKIKEYKNMEKFYLFGFILIYRRNISC